MNTLQTLEMALEALEYTTNMSKFLLGSEADIGPMLKASEAITALRQQIALEKMTENERELGIQMQPDEPAAWMYEFGTDHCDAVTPIRWYQNVTSLEKPDPEKLLVKNVVPLYTRPQPAREWVGLTDEEISQIEDEYIVDYRIPAGSAWNFAKDIEAKLKEKNT